MIFIPFLDKKCLYFYIFLLFIDFNFRNSFLRLNQQDIFVRMRREQYILFRPIKLNHYENPLFK